MCVVLRLETQWRVGLQGPTGMVYDSLPLWLELEDVDRKDWADVTTQVQEVEAEMLRLMRERR